MKSEKSILITILSLINYKLILVLIVNGLILWFVFDYWFVLGLVLAIFSAWSVSMFMLGSYFSEQKIKTGANLVIGAVTNNDANDTMKIKAMAGMYSEMLKVTKAMNGNSNGNLLSSPMTNPLIFDVTSELIGNELDD